MGKLSVLLFGFFLLISSFGLVSSLENCEDSDRSILTGGEVKYISPQGVLYVMQDSCLESGLKVEYYCNETSMLSEYYQCPTGLCSKGECVSCEPIGLRKNGQYCAPDGSFQDQKTTDAEGNWSSCENHYECESEFCVENECVSRGFIRAAIAWIKNIFG